MCLYKNSDAVEVGSIPFWKKHYPKNDTARVSAIFKEPTRRNGMLPWKSLLPSLYLLRTSLVLIGGMSWNIMHPLNYSLRGTHSGRIGVLVAIVAVFYHRWTSNPVISIGQVLNNYPQSLPFQFWEDCSDCC